LRRTQARVQLVKCNPWVSSLMILSPPPPPAIYYDWGACPFEGCTYRTWTTQKVVRLTRRPLGRPSGAMICVGVRVQGLTGVVISRPVAVRAKHDVEDTPIHAGDTFYLLHYVGEGEWRVMFNGKTFEVGAGETSRDRQLRTHAQWWVRVRDAAGHLGWVRSEGQFLNQDAFG
jgi:hypothetical protein